MKILTKIIILSSLIITNIALANNLRIPDEFMIKINPATFLVTGPDPSPPPQIIRSFNINNACMSLIPESGLITFKTCDSSDLLQRFRYESGQLINSLSQCLDTNFSRDTQSHQFVCSGRNQRSVDYSYRAGFRQCSTATSQNWTFGLTFRESTFLQQDSSCLKLSGYIQDRNYNCSFTDNNGFLVSRSGVIEEENIKIDTDTCPSVESSFQLEGVDGNVLIIERLLPIVVPL